jgi:hypothetical protein
VRPLRAVLCGLAVACAAVVSGCGVEVPDDVATATSTTTAPESTTTAPPMSDDELEQALIDNGYTLGEARCGAENLREELSESQIQELIETDINDIRESTATAVAEALQPCVEGGG